MLKVNWLPLLSSDVTSMVPPMCLTSSEQIDNPKPAPCSFLEIISSTCSNGLKIVASILLGMPWPVSETVKLSISLLSTITMLIMSTT